MSVPDSRDHRALLQRAFVELKDAREKLALAQQARSEPIAIIGIGCRFPGGADTPEAFWRLLRDGVDTITGIPKSRWDCDALFDPDPDTPGKMNTAWGGFLEHVDRFDADSFGIAPRGRDDPQRILQVRVGGAEDAGQPQQLAGTVPRVRRHLQL